MDIRSVWRNLHLRDKRNLYIALTLPLIGLSAAQLLKSLITSRPTGPRIYASPRKALQQLSQQELEDIPYPSDALPGGRDVDTPYGNIRVYEWGPEDGRKVLFVHGISTPCIAFARIARLLVEQGCRVMLFDLFGRGYSDCPDPEAYKQDMGLWTSQILLVLSSSRLAWTGSSRFSMVGYSMGGGISAAFTAYFPDLVESLVLIAPGGLIRPHRINASSRWLYGNFLPQFAIDYFVRRRLRDGSAEKPKPKQESLGPGKAIEAEVPDPGHPANAQDSTSQPFPERPRISIAMAVNWELEAHPGFLPAFISSIRYAPVTGNAHRWSLIGKRCEARRASAEPERLPGLHGSKVLVLLGATDSVIATDEITVDAEMALGKENVEITVLEGGHDVPIVNSSGCADAIIKMWATWKD